MRGAGKAPALPSRGVTGAELRRTVDELASRPPPPKRGFSTVDPALRPALAWGALHHPHPPTRWLCLDYLDHLAGPEAAETFLAALGDPVPRVRRHAIHALTCQACKPDAWCVDAMTPLRYVVAHDPSPKVRFEALRALLRQLDSARQAEAIEGVAGDRPLLDEVLHARRRAVPPALRRRAEVALASQAAT